MPKTYPNRIENALLTPEMYQALYETSIKNPDYFWSEMASRFVTWLHLWKQISSGNFADGTSRWFEGGILNVCYNCVDRHLEKHSDKIAYIWEDDEPGISKKITYRDLFQEVCRFANVLKYYGVKKGDVICIYMPMIPETIYAMLACARIGAVHSVVFGGFSAHSLRDRIQDANCKIVITADMGSRGGKKIPLKEGVDAAVAECKNVQHVIVVKQTEYPIHWDNECDVDYKMAAQKVSNICDCEPMQSEDPLFILYTSGSTGKPKGILHTTGGYLVYTATTFKYGFNYLDNEIYWCTADVGWITGHSYIVYGPLANAATSVIFAGIPTYPDASRFWQIIDKYNVNIFYTAPTAIRALMREGDDYVKKTQRTSLRLLGSVGEPINPEAWEWYYHVVGNARCPIVDTWWQTETGGFMILPLPNTGALKPGAAQRPFFGIQPAILNEQKNEITGEGEGTLVLKTAWPSIARTIYGNSQRFLDTYFNPFPGYYFTGDGARRDADGDYWITGRIDDIIIVSGHNLGTAELESILVSDSRVAEAAVVGVADQIKGHGIYAFVTLKNNVPPTEELKKSLIELVRTEIGPVATIDAIQWAPQLPKTRSGKIMRRILRKIAENDLSNLGDTSTLADPSVVDDLIQHRINL